MKGINDIRSSFLNFFEKNDHTIVKSSGVVPQNDPTLMFTNAGMVPFKDVFTGQEKRDYVRAASAQKCIRAGGKHNDLDNVGYTARHHTFFEMLGNFSFGDYFKEEAIALSWQMLTKEFGISPHKLLITVYAEDLQAYDIWKKLTGFHDDKIIKISTNDNFWSMGKVGPCGPCSEIFYDHGPDIFGGPPGSKDEDGDRFVEIWNIVFMQYEQLASGERISLPNRSIDTGMGIERIASVLQGVHNNYDTDLFKNIIETAKTFTNGRGDIQSYRIIADHIRSCAFMIADGITPLNEGRGYVLRRIMRRAMRHVNLLGVDDVLMYKLVPELINQMGGAYPELIHAKTFIMQTLKEEEEKFKTTLGKGLRLLNDAKTSIKNNILPGDVAFKLYDTFGFPLDLTQDILRKDSVKVDLVGFESEMKIQKDRARSAWSGSGDKANESVYFDLKEKFESTEFLGYSATQSQAVIQSILIDGITVDNAKKDDTVFILCNQTPFYAESGGQIGDQGMLLTPSGKVKIIDTQKKISSLFIHKGIVIEGHIAVEQTANLEVDKKMRDKITANHSGTHLLHAALRQLLGHHVVQKGSLVTDQKLRFDFTHSKAMTADELKAVEQIVNQQILENNATSIKLMSSEKAIEEGAMALFGEKYGDQVRVVSFGEDHFSVELCGGIHVNNTGKIGLLKIISESSVASGIRRIEAITGQSVIDYITNLEGSKENLEKTLKDSTLDFNKKIMALNQKLTLSTINSVEFQKSEGDVMWSHKTLKDISPADLPLIADKLLHKFPGVLIITNVSDDKIGIAIAVSKKYTHAINASDLIKNATVYLGGKGGGGRPDFAQGGGIDQTKISTLMNFLINNTVENS